MPLLENLKQAAHRLKTEVAVLGEVYKDPRTPWYAKVVIFVVIAHTLSPIDIIPDFIPVLGYLDDLILVPLGIALAIKLVPKEVFAEARVTVAGRLEDTGISGWWFGVLIVIFWICIIYWMVWSIWFKGK